MTGARAAYWILVFTGLLSMFIGVLLGDDTPVIVGVGGVVMAGVLFPRNPTGRCARCGAST